MTIIIVAAPGLCPESTFHAAPRACKVAHAASDEVAGLESEQPAEANVPFWWPGTERAAFVLLGSLLRWLAFLARERYRQAKTASQHLGDYQLLLKAAQREVDFYLGKLKQLGPELDTLIGQASGPNQVFSVPSYGLYAAFLEQSKLALAKFKRNPDVVASLGVCHFELSHVARRLELLHDQGCGRVPESNALHVDNLGSFKILVTENVSRFAKLSKDLEQEIALVSKELPGEGKH